VPTKSSHDDDEISELPPLDGSEGDEEKVDVGEHALDTAIDDANPFDDEEAGDPNTEDESIDEGEAFLLGEEVEDVDIGDAVGIVEEKVALSEYEPSGRLDLAEDEFEEKAWERDDGEEGPTADNDSLLDGSLPAMDADDDSEMDDAALFDPSFLREAAREIAWDDKIWERRSEGGIEPAEEDPEPPTVAQPPSDGRIVSFASRGDRTVVMIEDECAYLSGDDHHWEPIAGTERCTAVGFVGDVVAMALQNAGSGGVICLLRESGLTKVAELHEDETPVVQIIWDGRLAYARTASKTIVFDVK